MNTAWINYADGKPISSRKPSHRVGAHYRLDDDHGTKLGAVRFVINGHDIRWRAITTELEIVGHYKSLSLARRALLRRAGQEA